MFKKTKLAAATVALLSVAAVQNASAVAIDESGTNAQVLIFPYYNTNNDYSTGFNIRNTKNEVKAVKVRLRESKLSNDVLDFNVYMSPRDHFSFSVGVNASGHATLYTQDTTCTFPAIPSTGAELIGNVYTKTNYDDAREGYVEVIEMGVVTDATVKAGVTHTTASVPKDCSVVATAWASGGAFTRGGANAVIGGQDHSGVIPTGVSAPTGGLQGWSFLVDLAQGNANVAMPAAIRNYQTGHAQHYRSDDSAAFLLPSLASGNDATSVVMNNAGTNALVTTWNKATDYVTTTVGAAEITGTTAQASGVNPYPIAHVLAATAVSNDYLVTSTADSAGTDWVITFPMRKHGIYAYSAYNATTGSATASDVMIDGGSTAFYNREEQKVVINNAGFSPVATAPDDILPREVNILSFGLKTNNGGAATNVLRSKYIKPYGVDYSAGWGVLSFKLPSATAVDTLASPATVPANVITNNAITGTASNNGTVINGVPAIGFAAIRGNYAAGAQNVIGESIPHTFTRVR